MTKMKMTAFVLFSTYMLNTMCIASMQDELEREAETAGCPSPMIERVTEQQPAIHKFVTSTQAYINALEEVKIESPNIKYLPKLVGAEEYKKLCLSLYRVTNATTSVLDSLDLATPKKRINELQKELSDKNLALLDIQSRFEILKIELKDVNINLMSKNQELTDSQSKLSASICESASLTANLREKDQKVEELSGKIATADANIILQGQTNEVLNGSIRFMMQMIPQELLNPSSLSEEQKNQPHTKALIDIINYVTQTHPTLMPSM